MKMTRSNNFMKEFGLFIPTLAPQAQRGFFSLEVFSNHW